MGVDALLFLLAAIISALLLFIMVYFVIMFTDLENDYINPIDLCTKLNHFVIPNYVVHTILTLFFLFTGKWLTFLFNLPLLCYNIKRYIDNRHLFDATEIIRTLSYDKKESFIKLVFFFISFFIYLYEMVMAILTNK